MRVPCLPALLLSLLLTALAVPAAQAETVADVLRRSHAAMVERGSFVAEIRADAGGRTVDSRVAVIWPDRYHMTSTGGGTDMETIIVPGGSYMKQGGEWMKLPMDMGQMIRAFQPDAMEQSLANLANAEELPAETVDGRRARVFRYDTSARVMGIRSSSTVKVWLDADTLLPIQQEVDGEAMGTKSRTTQRYSYPDALRIEAPR